MSSRPTQLEEKDGDRVNARGCSRQAGSYVFEQLRQGDRTVLNRVRRTWRLLAEGCDGVCNICTPGCRVRRGGSGGGDGLKVNLESRSNVLRGRGDVPVAGVANGWHSRLGTGLGVAFDVRVGLFGARGLRPGSVDRLDTCRVPSEFGRVDSGGDSSVRRPEFGACLLCGGKLAGDVSFFPAAHEVFNVWRHPPFRFAWEDAYMADGSFSSRGYGGYKCGMHAI